MTDFFESTRKELVRVGTPVRNLFGGSPSRVWQAIEKDFEDLFDGAISDLRGIFENTVSSCFESDQEGFTMEFNLPEGYVLDLSSLEASHSADGKVTITGKYNQAQLNTKIPVREATG